MLPAERIACAFAREKPDLVPIFDLVSNVDLLTHWAGEPVTLENAEETIPRATSKFLDMTRIFLPQNTGGRVDRFGFTYERTDWFNEWQVAVPFRDIEELERFVRAETEYYRDLDAVVRHSEVAAQRLWESRYCPTVLPASGCGEALQDAYIRVGLDWFIYINTQSPQLVKEWLSARHSYTLRNIQSLLQQHAASKVAWIFGDVAYKQRLMFSPRYLAENGFFDRIKEIADLYHSFGLKVIFHSDGDIRGILAPLVEAGIDGVGPIDTSAGMELLEVRKLTDRQVTLVGGVDIETVLRVGAPESIHGHIQNLLKAWGEEGGLIIGSSSEELFQDLPIKNILAFHEAVAEYSR